MTTLAEPEWDDSTRDLALAHDSWERCPVCKGPAFLCQDPERMDDWEAKPPVRCHRMTTLYKHQSTFSEQTNPHLNALIWPVELRRKGG